MPATERPLKRNPLEEDLPSLEELVADMQAAERPLKQPFRAVGVEELLFTSNVADMQAAERPLKHDVAPDVIWRMRLIADVPAAERPLKHAEVDEEVGRSPLSQTCRPRSGH